MITKEIVKKAYWIILYNDLNDYIKIKITKPWEKFPKQYCYCIQIDSPNFFKLSYFQIWDVSSNIIYESKCDLLLSNQKKTFIHLPIHRKVLVY